VLGVNEDLERGQVSSGLEGVDGLGQSVHADTLIMDHQTIECHKVRVAADLASMCIVASPLVLDADLDLSVGASAFVAAWGVLTMAFAIMGTGIAFINVPAEAIVSEFISCLAVSIFLGNAPVASQWALSVVPADRGRATSTIGVMLAEGIAAEVGAFGLKDGLGFLPIELLADESVSLAAVTISHLSAVFIIVLLDTDDITVTRSVVGVVFGPQFVVEWCTISPHPISFLLQVIQADQDLRVSLVGLNQSVHKVELSLAMDGDQITSLLVADFFGLVESVDLVHELVASVCTLKVDVPWATLAVLAP